MDVFFYYKNLERDLKAGSLGYLPADSAKLATLRERAPDNIWIFHTPKGHKGDVQLLARVKWSDKPVTAMPEEIRAEAEAGGVMFYDPRRNSGSVLYVGTETAAAIREVSSLLRNRYLKAFKAGFKGSHALQEIEMDLVRQLNRFAAGFATELLLEKKAAPVSDQEQPHPASVSAQSTPPPGR